jgi:hypothetical protein
MMVKLVKGSFKYVHYNRVKHSLRAQTRALLNILVQSAVISVVRKMTKLPARIIVILSLLPTFVLACPDDKFEKQLVELTSLTASIIQEDPSSEALAKFFTAMPTTFSCFNRLFGYDDKPAPLYFEPQLHVLFPKFRAAVPINELTTKLVNLAVNARWEADQTGALQDAVRNILEKDTVLFMQIMQNHDQNDQASIWLFLFDDPHPMPFSGDVQKLICQISKNNCAASKAAYKEKTATGLGH